MPSPMALYTARELVDVSKSPSIGQCLVLMQVADGRPVLKATAGGCTHINAYVKKALNQRGQLRQRKYRDLAANQKILDGRVSCNTRRG